MDKKEFTLRFTLGGQWTELACDGVTLVMPDDEEGRGGGLLGIRPGHQDALIALAPGRVRAVHLGQEIFSAEVAGGLACVDKTGVTVLGR